MSTDTWVDFDLFGRQLSLHLGEPFTVTHTGHVGEHRVPIPHYGLVMEIDDWRALADRLSDQGIDFVIPPSVCFPGEPGEQSTMFFRDPCGNPIEVKGFASLDKVYAT